MDINRFWIMDIGLYQQLIRAASTVVSPLSARFKNFLPIPEIGAIGFEINYTNTIYFAVIEIKSLSKEKYWGSLIC